MSAFKKNIISLLFLQGSNYLIPLMTFPYLTRTLNVDGFGYYSLIFSIVQYIVLFVDFGYNLSASKTIATAKGNRDIISKCFFITMTSKLLLATMAIAVIFIVNYFINDKISNVLIFSVLQIIGTVLFPIWFFQGIEKMTLVSISSILGRILTLPLMFLLVKDNTDLSIAILIQSSSLFIIGIISLFLVRKYNLIKKVDFTIKDVIESYKNSYQYYVAGLAISLYSISTPIIIKYTSTIEQVGLFSSADKLKSAGLGVFLVLGHAIYPRVNRLFSESRINAFRFVKKIFIYQGVLTFSISIFIFIFSSEIVSIVLGDSYLISSDVLRILSPLFFLITQSVVFGNYLLLPLGFKKTYTILPLFSAIIHIILCAILSYKFGAIGGALSILSIEVVTFVAYIVILERNNIIYEWWRA